MNEWYSWMSRCACRSLTARGYSRVYSWWGGVMRGAVLLVLVGVVSLGACGGDDDDAADAGAASTTARGEQIVIRTRMVIAAEEGAEPIATGGVLDRSTLGDSPFCAGGTVVDSHGAVTP